MVKVEIHDCMDKLNVCCFCGRLINANDPPVLTVATHTSIGENIAIGKTFYTLSFHDQVPDLRNSEVEVRAHVVDFTAAQALAGFGPLLRFSMDTGITRPLLACWAWWTGGKSREVLHHRRRPGPRWHGVI